MAQIKDVVMLDGGALPAATPAAPVVQLPKPATKHEAHVPLTLPHGEQEHEPEHEEP